MKRSIAAILLIATSTSIAVARPLKPDQEAKIAPAGPAVQCVPVHSIRETRVRDDRTVDFYMDGGKVYRNKLPQECPELGFEERFGYETSIDQLCNVDIIHVLHESPPIPGAACGLGMFQPITGAPR